MIELEGMGLPGSGYSSDSTDSTYDLDWKFSTNCTNLYGDYICIYNDGSLWTDGIGIFEYSGCKDDYPYFYYNYEEGNYTMMYYLHYNSIKGWYVSEHTLMDTTGVALCSEDDVRDCTLEHWYLMDTSNTDAISYELDENMGYEENCESEISENGVGKDAMVTVWTAIIATVALVAAMLNV